MKLISTASIFHHDWSNPPVVKGVFETRFKWKLCGLESPKNDCTQIAHFVIAVESLKDVLVQGRTLVLSCDDSVPENADKDDFSTCSAIMMPVTYEIENNKFYSDNAK